MNPISRIALAVATALVALAALPLATLASAAAVDADAEAHGIVHVADLVGPACPNQDGVRPQGEAGYLAIPGRGASLDIRVSQVLCHQEQRLVITIEGREVGAIYIEAGGRGVAHFDTTGENGLPRVHRGARIALRTHDGRFVMGGVFR
jgi:hypothetical protein